MTSELDRLLELVRVDNYHDIMNVEELAEMDTVIFKLKSLIEDGKKWQRATNSERFNKCNDDKDGYCMFEKEVSDLQSQLAALSKKYGTSIEEYNKLSQKHLGLTSQNFDLESQNKQLKEEIKRLENGL